MRAEEKAPRAGSTTPGVLSQADWVWHRLPRVVLSVALGVLLVFTVFRYIAGILVFTRLSSAGYDFSIYYAAALALRDNPHADIFSTHVLTAAATAHHASYSGAVFLYPPFLAVIMMPLTLLPYRSALQVWILVNGWLWLGSAALLIRWSWQVLFTGAYGVARVRSVHARLAAFFTVALGFFLVGIYEPFGENLGLGQVSGAVLFLLLIAWLLAEHGHDRAAGSVLALAVWIKLLPALLIVYLVFRGRWRIVIAAAVACVVLGLALVPVIGLQGVLATRYVLTNGGFMASLAHNEALARVPVWISIALGGGRSGLALFAGYALVALVAIAFVLGMRRVRQMPELPEPMRAGHETLGFFWAMATMVLLSPVTWEHHDIWLLPALEVGFFAALPYCARGLRDEQGHFRREVVLLLCATLGYALTMSNMPFGYDGATHYVIGPYVGSVALRPFFMLVRPAGGLLAWIAAGVPFIWPRTQPADAREPSGLLLSPGALGLAFVMLLLIALCVQSIIGHVVAAFPGFEAI